jgi:HK97 family phage prohead protease
MTERKEFRAPIALKEADGQEGTFDAVFATFNVVDRDRDVTKPGAFRDGQKVRISAWGHNWGVLPVGKGVIHADDEKAWVDGRFFLDTEGGLDTYRTVKGLEELQEWSYGFDILTSAEGEFDGERVRYLESLDVYEVSPVMLGAGIGTRTTGIKSSAADAEGANADADDEADGSEGEAGDGNPSGGEAELVRIGLDLDLMALED